MAGSLVIFSLATPAAAGPQALGPFKDDLFAYPPLTATAPDGATIDVDYSETRDIDQRDEVPERRVLARYVDMTPRAFQNEATLDTGVGPLAYTTVGRPGPVTAIVVFMHGRNGDRRLGMNDRTFGGNFNRLKNLLLRSGGLYVTVDGGRFEAADEVRFSTLIDALKRQHPEATLVLACASMGGGLCWHAVAEPKTMADVDAIVMLSAANDAAKISAMRKSAGKRLIPIVIAHGTRDKVFPYADQQRLVETLRNSTPKEPLMFISFHDGNHGTPIRMIDWRGTLNWIFARVP